MTAIDDKYFQLIKDPAFKFLGQAATPETPSANGGRFRDYDGGASIYWTPQTGAHIVYGKIREKWVALGREKSPLGYPTTDEGEAANKLGRYNNFQHGAILFKWGAQEAFSLHGDIYAHWGQQGYEGGALGMPDTDEQPTPDGIGRFNHFDGGSIYWTPTTGAHSVKGAIRQLWAAEGWETSRLQYPVSDELVTDGTNGLGRHSDFEGGQIFWTPQGGTKVNLYPTAERLVNSAHDLNANDVHATQIWVKFMSDGNWQFHAYLHDSGTFAGDAYAIGFALQGDGHGTSHSGTIGHGNSNNTTISMSGTDPWIAQFWHKVKQTGVNFDLKQSSNLGGILESLIGTIASDAAKYVPLLS